MPSPNTGETENEFISRCMGDAEANRSFPESDQRAAFCYSQWRNKTINEVTRLINELADELRRNNQ